MDPNPYAPPRDAPPPSPVGSLSARTHRVVNVALLLAGALFGAAMLLGETFPRPGDPRHVWMDDWFVTMLDGWALAACTWGPVVAYGLLARRPWAARTATFYWLLSLFGCFSTLPAIYGLYATTRPSFKKLFERREP